MIRMKHTCGKVLFMALSLLAMIPTAEAVPFTNAINDLCLGFRKTGANQGTYECVVDIGPAINYVLLPPGTTTNITQYTASQIVPDSYANFNNLSWSVSGYVESANIPAGYPANTVWMTVPRTNGVSVTAPLRASTDAQSAPALKVTSIFSGANYISGNLNANQDNTPTFVQEPYTVAISNGRYYGAFMGNPTYPSIGDLGGTAPTATNGATINLEFTTAASFSGVAKSDLYEVRPAYLTAGRPATNVNIMDPYTGLTNGAGYYVGYFQLSSSGTMTFTRDGAPTAGFASAPPTGLAPFQVVFTNTCTGTVTNWAWSFGDGHTYTNSSPNTYGGTATNTYTAPGRYTVALTVVGPTGTNTSTVANYVVVTSGSTPPVASFSGTPTTGFAPLTVILTDTSTGTVTNRAWSFGDGHTYTNTTSLYATNTYTTNGSYTVSLTATGPGGTNTSSVAKYVVVSPAPHFGGAILVGTNLVIGGTNGPAGVQYRILSTTNLTSALASWLPVYTNTFNALGNFGYTNAATKSQSYFKLVSP